MDIVMGFDLIKNKVFFHSPALIYSRQGCYSSPKFLSVRQISKIHRVAPGTRLKKKKMLLPCHMGRYTRDLFCFLSVI